MTAEPKDDILNHLHSKIAWQEEAKQFFCRNNLFFFFAEHHFRLALINGTENYDANFNIVFIEPEIEFPRNFSICNTIEILQYFQFYIYTSILYINIVQSGNKIRP